MTELSLKLAVAIGAEGMGASHGPAAKPNRVLQATGDLPTSPPIPLAVAGPAAVPSTAITQVIDELPAPALVSKRGPGVAVALSAVVVFGIAGFAVLRSSSHSDAALGTPVALTPPSPAPPAPAPPVATPTEVAVVAPAAKAPDVAPAVVSPPTPAAASETGVGELAVVVLRNGQPFFATVYVDGQRLGNSPIVRTVSAGHHQVHLERAGFKAEDRAVTVSAGHTSRLRVELTP
jgi:hypothetical protein